MNMFKKIYKFIFERDCLDFSEPYIPLDEDSGFSKYNTPVTKNKAVTYHTEYSPNAVGGYLNSKGEWVRENTMGYHNTMGAFTGTMGMMSSIARTWQ